MSPPRSSRRVAAARPAQAACSTSATTARDHGRQRQVLRRTRPGEGHVGHRHLLRIRRRPRKLCRPRRRLVSLEAVSLCSCGVATGWGSAVNVADVSAGDTVVVVGTGGIGVNAVQGAAMAGAANVIAVDPIEMKREFAQTMGATHAVASIEEATPLVQELSWGAAPTRSSSPLAMPPPISSPRRWAWWARAAA